MGKNQQSSDAPASGSSSRASASEYLDALSMRFRPARDVRDTTHWMTTTEIFNAIRDLDPGTELSLYDLFESMKSSGYIYSSRPGTHSLMLQWQLHEIENKEC